MQKKETSFYLSAGVYLVFMLEETSYIPKSSKFLASRGVTFVSFPITSLLTHFCLSLDFFSICKIISPMYLVSNPNLQAIKRDGVCFITLFIHIVSAVTTCAVNSQEMSNSQTQNYLSQQQLSGSCKMRKLKFTQLCTVPTARGKLNLKLPLTLLIWGEESRGTEAWKKGMSYFGIGNKYSSTYSPHLTVGHHHEILSVYLCVFDERNVYFY